MGLDLKKIRTDFPILNTTIYGKPLIYFDNAATTQKPLAVIEKINEMYTRCNSNVHRGVHFLSTCATNEMEAARKTAQKFLNAGSESEIIFTRGTTEAVNLIAFSFSEEFLGEGDEIIVSEMEHHSNLVPWQMACSRKKAKLVQWDMNDNGELSLTRLRELINSKTRIIALTHVSNALGTINPVKEIIEIAHGQGIPVFIDGAQAVQHISVDVQSLDCDFYAFSGHKVYGPTGIGVLYGKSFWLKKLPPYQGGGEMIKNVWFSKSEYNESPFKFEAGTPDYVGAAALGSALDYIADIGIDSIAKHEKKLLEYATDKLRNIDGFRIIGNASNKCSVISFLISNTHPYDVGVLLDQLGIAVRTGTHCAETVMQHYNISGTARISFGLYNSPEEIDIMTNSLARIVKML